MRNKIIFFLIFSFFISCSLFRSTLPSYAPEMVYVEGGSFLMGDFYNGADPDALPLHKVSLPSFYIGKFEVTFAEYDQFALATTRKLPNDKKFGRGNRAVVFVSWDDASAFCKSLGYRLPTEAEWEFAARSRGQNHLYAGTSDLDSLKFYALGKDGDIHFSFPVGTKKPNALGIHDMSGNVFEWIGDFHQIYSMPEVLHDNKKDGVRLFRGGSFLYTRSMSTYKRVGTLHDTEASDIGFQCAASK